MDTIIQQAIDLANAGHKEQALQLFREIVRRDPSQAAAFKWIAHLTSDPREAYAAIKRVLSLDPDDQWAQEYAARLQTWIRQQQAQSPPAAAQQTVTQPIRRTSMKSVLTTLFVAVVLVLAGGAVGLALVLGPDLISGDSGGPVIPDQAQAESEAAILPVTATPIPTIAVTDPPSSTPSPTDTPVDPAVDPQPTAGETQPDPGTGSDAVPTDPPPTEIPTLSGVPITYNPQTTYYTFEAETIPQIQDALFLYGPSDMNSEGLHAIATTTYNLGISWKTVEMNRSCSLTESTITLDLTYLYPQWNPVDSPSQDVYDEWDRFLAHVIDHEEHHADIAYGCAEELAGQVAALQISGPCQGVVDQLNALADQMYTTCDQRQIAFDDVEGQTTFPLP
jgi:predicted secreted Zn-dependent protease